MRTDRLLRSLRRLLGAQDGAAAVELAIVGPVFFAFMVATIELALVMFINVGIEAAVRDGARYGITGSVPDGVSREDQLRAVIKARTVGLVDMSTVTISTKVYPTFASAAKDEAYTDTNGNGKWDPGESFTDDNGNGTWDGGVAGMGGSGEIVLYTISYGLPLIAPATKDLFGVSALSLAARIVVRNEPWTPS